MGGQLLVIFISGAVFAGAGEGFGPFQRGFFARAEERRFAPKRQVAQTQFALARFFGTFAVHIEAKQAAVYLRGADFHELAQARFDSGIGHGFFQSQHGVGGSGGEGVIVGTVIHMAAFFKMETLKIYHGLPPVLPFYTGRLNAFCSDGLWPAGQRHHACRFGVQPLLTALHQKG